MTRSYQTGFKPVAPLDYGIDSEVATTPETDVLQNINWLHAHKVVPFVVHLFGDDAQDMWVTAENNGPTEYTIGSWLRDIDQDFDQVRCVVRAKNENASNGGRVTFNAVDSTNSASITIAAATTETTFETLLDVDTTLTEELFSVDIGNPTDAVANGGVSIQSVCIYPYPLSSPLDAGVTSEGFVPMDTAQTTSDQPLTTYLRQTQLDNLDTLTTKRTPGSVLSFTENHDERTHADYRVRVTTGVYQHVISLPVYIPPRVTKVKWSVSGFMDGGSGGKVKLSCQNDIGEESAGFGTTWTDGDENQAAWQTPTALDVLEMTNETIKIQIKSDGTNATHLAGLCIWLGDADG